MIIPIPTGMKYTAQAWGSTIKRVTCAHCGTSFVYELRRVVQAEANAELFIGMGAAKQRAVSNAQDTLVRTLQKEHDSIPCPKCELLQPEMVRAIRAKWLVAIVATWFILVLVALFRYLATELGRTEPSWVYVLGIGATIAAVAAAIYVCMKEFHAAATDRAQTAEEADAEGYFRLKMPRVLKDGWIWTRPTLFESPAICAGCGTAATTTLRRSLGSLLIEARVCDGCYGRAILRRILWAVITVLAAIAVVFVIAWLSMNHDVGDALGVSICVGPIAGLFALAIINNWFLKRAGMPIRFRNFRARQDSVELKFKNSAAAEEYLAGVIQRMQAALQNAASPPRDDLPT